ncbi:hypothetical protein GCM10022218_34200 [Sphingobacterium ginsenosidimutans]|uniref:Bulb-type lectin domain-containing protein n=2 Tax=Sphingobacterium ginsenosidimutans TaxID=687845 RepID=A0ABP8A9X4_9SPHI
MSVDTGILNGNIKTKSSNQTLNSSTGCNAFAPNFSTGSCGWPSNWFNNYVIKKKLPTVTLDTVYYRRSIIRPEAKINFPIGITSPNNRYTLIGQPDGNLYIHDNSTNKVLWDAGSYKYGNQYPYQMRFQEDGNLVIYANKTGLFDHAVWATDNLYVPSTDYFYSTIRYNSMYILQDDGNLVLYRDINGGGLVPETVIRLQPVAHTGTWDGRKSAHWREIK